MVKQKISLMKTIEVSLLVLQNLINSIPKEEMDAIIKQIDDLDSIEDPKPDKPFRNEGFISFILYPVY